MFWVLMGFFAIMVLLSNIKWGYQENKKIANQSEIKIKNKRFLYSFAFKEFEEELSLLGVLFFYVVYIPTFILSCIDIALEVLSIITILMKFEISWLLPEWIFLGAIIIGLYYIISYMVFLLIIKVSGFIRYKKTKNLKINNIIIRIVKEIKWYTWIFVIACLPIPLVFNNANISIVICVLGCIGCIMVSLMNTAKFSKFILIYVLSTILALTWSVAYIIADVYYSGL